MTDTSRRQRRHTPFATRATRTVLAVVAGALLACKGRSESAPPGATTGGCTQDNGGIALPAGFCASVFAEGLGHARHLVVAPNGDVYVNTWSGSYYDDKPPAGGFVVALRDTNHDGAADIVSRFGATGAAGGHGGTGIAIHNGALYTEEGATIVRYALAADSLVPSGHVDTIVRGLPLTGNHPMHPFVIDSAGGLYVDLGSATNSCQQKNRTAASPGVQPCTELETRGGIWRYDASKTNQDFSPAERFATGIRNADGITIGPDGNVYATQHGRDQLAENWPKLYTPEQGQNLPAEELLHVDKGGDYGWPYCYFDNTQQKLVLAPEYGGDGKAVGQCAQKLAPLAFFPAHWAPLDLLFYTGTQFPASYQGGVFIAFHGSWNRSPGPQGGYNVVFVPFVNGKPSSAPGEFQKFADGFAGSNVEPDRATHRPAGLAQSADGALYISDDKGGRVWRVIYTGAK